MRGLGAPIELALAVACWFRFFVVICWVCVCVCLGLGQCFRGSTECRGDGFLGIIDLISLKTERS